MTKKPWAGQPRAVPHREAENRGLLNRTTGMVLSDQQKEPIMQTDDENTENTEAISQRHCLRLQLGPLSGDAHGWLGVSGLILIGLLIVIL